MAKTGNFFHQVSNITPVASVGTAFDAAKLHAVNLNQSLGLRAQNRGFKGRLETIYVALTSISGASTITMRGVDANGAIILPDTTATIAVDITTATEGSVAFYAGNVWEIAGGDELKIYCKTDAGTVTVSAVGVNWSE